MGCWYGAVFFFFLIKVLTVFFAGIPRDHPESYHSFMWTHLFKHIDIDPKNAHILDGNAPDLAAECAAFEAHIKEAGGIELFIGGEAEKKIPEISITEPNKLG